MKQYCFVLASSSDRVHLLKRCIESLNKNNLYKDADIYLFWQGDENEIPYKNRFAGIISSDRLRGVFYPRYALFEKFSVDYEYTILIDDDLFVYEDTSYENAMRFLKMINNNGICNLGRQFDKRRNELRRINYSSEDYNVNGGLVIPNKGVKILVDFFKDTDESVTEDIFWILLYIKGFDLYKDFTSNALHSSHRKSKNGEASGYFKWRLEKPHVPLLPQYTKQKLVKDFFGDRMRYKIPECRDVNEAGMIERAKCRKEMGL